MSAAWRLRLFVVAAAVVGTGLVWGMSGLPAFGHYHGVYGTTLARVAVPERRATDVVSSVTFDYRGFDTLGEEFILFAAVLGLVVLLRAQKEELRRERPEEEAEDRRAPKTSDVLRTIGLGLVGPTVVIGVYIVAHGHITPGGGFQGGVILSSALLLVFLAGRYRAMRRVSPIPMVEAGEAAGAAAFALIGLGGMIFASAYMFNFIALGKPAQLLSAGMIPLLNVSVGLEVAGAFTLLFTEFLDQALLVRLRRRRAAAGGAGEQ